MVRARAPSKMHVWRRDSVGRVQAAGHAGAAGCAGARRGVGEGKEVREGGPGRWLLAVGCWLCGGSVLSLSICLLLAWSLGLSEV